MKPFLLVGVAPEEGGLRTHRPPNVPYSGAFSCCLRCSEMLPRALRCDGCVVSKCEEELTARRVGGPGKWVWVPDEEPVTTTTTAPRRFSRPWGRRKDS